MKKAIHIIAKTTWVVFLTLAAFAVNAQEKYTLSGDQVIKVSGTSTIHDWDMVAKSGMSGDIQLKTENGVITALEGLKLTIPVNTLKSGKSSMDKNAYEALKSKANPKISFELVEVLGITPDTVKVKGKLTVAGTSKLIPLEAKYIVNGNAVDFAGKHEITFTEFKIDPPTAMFNTIKTGDNLTLSFNTQFKSAR
ncbi:YceI family protein [Echinicola jeungdonensis]|nr:YceI family protein [Echinicola jeungdonensis]MDN3667796.1 YceI family protein [Echinicola jeungdonensis]